MRSLRVMLSIALAVYMTQAGSLVFAQDADTSPFSITLAPVQYADVKGNVGKFEALNWMPQGENAGVSDISFVKDINKDISLDVEGSEFPKSDDGDGHLTLKDGDLGFLKIDYNAFRKYYDNTGGIYPNFGAVSGAKANSPDLQLDISKFSLEAGLGPISDPLLDVTYEHDSKNGDKSLEQWSEAYMSSSLSKLIAPSWEAVNDTVDTLTVKENKEFAGFTLKGDQKLEVDYNSNVTNMPYVYAPGYVPSSNPNINYVDNESPDAKLFGSGLRAERWMFNDNTYASLGYHYNHTSATDVMEQQETTTSALGAVTILGASSPYTFGTSLWNTAKDAEDDHVWVGNINTNLTPDLSFLSDIRYEHMGSEGSSMYYTISNTSTTNPSGVSRQSDLDHQDNEGEHVALRYSGIPHTSLYGEGEFEQDKDFNDGSEAYLSGSNSSDAAFSLERINRTDSDAWTIGGRVVPNRFFTFTTEVKSHDQNSEYDTLYYTGSNGLILMDALREKGTDETSTLTWKPYHWLQNSLKYQFSDTVYNPQLAPSAGGSKDPIGGTDGNYNITENHMLTSNFTYDITVQPIDPLLVTLSYSHVENYVRTVGASSDGTTAESGPYFLPEFNSGDNSWLISDSYMPFENLTWTNTACYTLSSNYVDVESGIPLGADFKMLNVSTGLDWTYHKWLTVGPKYEHASYRDNGLSGDGNYSANIFMLDLKFKW